MKLEKFLPIGTVVLLKGGKDKLMITGFLAVNLDDNDSSENAYDYSGCPYPEGMLSVDETFLFNHEDIEEIFYVGFINEEEVDFKARLAEALKEADKLAKNNASKE